MDPSVIGSDYYDQVVNTSLLEESVAGGPGLVKNHYISGIFLQCDIQNINRRTYPSDVLDPHVRNYISTHVNTGRAVGELGHPPAPSNFDINYERVSHKIVSIEKSGSNWIGRAKITRSTPRGAVVAALMDEGVKFGVSCRMMAETVKRPNGAVLVSSVRRIITLADIVDFPSAPDALVTNLMEGVDWLWQDNERVMLEHAQIVNNKSKIGKLTGVEMKRIFDSVISSIGERKNG